MGWDPLSKLVFSSHVYIAFLNKTKNWRLCVCNVRCKTKDQVQHYCSCRIYASHIHIKQIHTYMKLSQCGLKPIERGQLGLRNFITCHFIYIQYFRWKFQPCPSFYPHPNISDIFVGDEMNIFWFPLLFLCTSIIKQRAHTQLSIYIHLSNH